MFSRFFIERPIAANVIAIVTMLLGVVSLYRLPIEQYPQITPGTVKVTTSYPGASAQVVANTVAAPIEQQVNGVENMLYMSSTSSNDGSYALTVTFDIGTNLDTAQVLVQNRVAIAQAQLPDDVKRQGITTKKQSTAIILFVVLTSDDPTHDTLFLSNYATIRLRDNLSRLKGVGDITIVGSADYSMRLWLDPEKLKARNLTVQDVLNAIEEQNIQVAAGQVGRPPSPNDRAFQYTITTLGRLNEISEFENIIVKTGKDVTNTLTAAANGSTRTDGARYESARLVRFKDIGRVELGGQNYDQYFLQNGRPAAGLAVFQLPGANALSVAQAVRDEMEKLQADFPKGMRYEIPFDTTKFVDASIHAVYHTLIEAGVLVLVVILVFLQDWRAVLVPATTVPVTIIGAFAAMWAFGFSINMLTLFGLILAIGIVVDDAIVIVENAAHHIEADKVSPKIATIRAMDELLGPIIGITLVLAAVFLPTAFLSGITGQLYRQFALTIAATAGISAINALTLKPAQCASYLRPHDRRDAEALPRWGYALIGGTAIWYFGGGLPGLWIGGAVLFWFLARFLNPILTGFYHFFNFVYGGVERFYAFCVRFVLRAPTAVMVVFAVLVAITFYGFVALPTGFLPTEDQGYIIISLQLPDAASQARTQKVVGEINDIIKDTPGVLAWTTVGGNNIFEGTTTSNAAAFYVVFKDWKYRTEKESQPHILAHLGQKLAALPSGVAFPFPPPAIQGLGVAGGFQMQVEDLSGVGLTELERVTEAMVVAGNDQSNLRALNTTFSNAVPQLYLNIDRVKAKSLNVPLGNVFGTLQTYLGSSYVNDFNNFERTYQVRVQADARFRAKPDDIPRLEVRNATGQMIPLGTLLQVKEQLGPQTITRYNLHPSASITGQAAPGVSSGDALILMGNLAKTELPTGMGYDWTGMSFQEKRVGAEALYVFALAVMLVYLVLAFQYESWTSPFAVILVVPLALLGTVAMVALRGMDNNVYTQIGIVLIIALASKNAILIVEFARELREKGESITEAAAVAARMRFRPILMTSFAFILGVVPLVWAEGAGAASRQALGTAVFGGMIASTVLAVFFVPVFYLVVQNFSEWIYGPPPRKESEREGVLTEPSPQLPDTPASIQKLM
jgi:HAE1 family hydrophobic/amphiphilic exporter-1